MADFQLTRYRWVILGLAWWAFLGTWLSRMSYPPLLPEIRGLFNLSFAQAGLLMTGWWVGYQFTQLPGGFITDKIGVRKTYLIFVTLMGIFTILVGFSGGYGDFLVLRVLSGLFGGFFYAASTTMVLKWFPPQRRAFAFGIYQTSWTTGLIVSVIASPIISVVFGSWRWSFWILGIPIVAAAMANIFLLRDNFPVNRDILRDKPKVAERFNYSLIFKNKNMWALIVVSFGVVYGIGATVTWIPIFLTRTFNVSTVFAGSTLALFAVGGTIGGVLGGFFADRILKRRGPLILVSTIIVGLAETGFAFANAGGIAFVVALVILVGFAANVGMSLVPPLFSRWLPLNILGTASGFWNFLSGAGAILSPVMIGLILDTTNSFEIAWISTGLVAIALSILAIPVIRDENRHLASQKQRRSAQ